MNAPATTASRERADRELDLGPGAMLGLFREMLRIRMVEEEIAARYPVEDQKMRCPVHLSVGQEAIAVGMSAVLRGDDQVVSNHRCHAHYLAKGGDLKAMLAELYGKAAGCCGGRGGSMHLFDPAAGVLLSLPVVGSSIPIGVGAALAFKQQGRDSVAVIYLGDAALEEGVYHESANFAALRGLPAVFVCENNLYSVYTPLDQRQPARPLVEMGRAHGLACCHVDGNDVRAVLRASAEAVDQARGGGGAVFILADTYRWREHCGPFYDNDLGYRSEQEFQAWRKRDPIARHRRLLSEAGILDPEREAPMARAIEDEIAEAFAFAEAAPYPAPDTAGDGVYA
jgi:TPP-dependent pyruvate/acetoin dehydrogenase alpha subunit